MRPFSVCPECCDVHPAERACPTCSGEPPAPLKVRERDFDQVLVPRGFGRAHLVGLGVGLMAAFGVLAIFNGL